MPPRRPAPPAHVTTLLDTFAAKVRAKRTRLGLSQADLAALAGVQDSYISMLERGQRTPPLDTVAIIAHALGVAPRDLL